MNSALSPLRLAVCAITLFLTSLSLADSQSPDSQPVDHDLFDFKNWGPTAVDLGSASAPAMHTAFSRGSWVSIFYMSGTVFSPDHVIGVHIGVGYYFADNVSINFEAVADYIDFQARNSDRGGASWDGGGDLLLRWHLVKGDNWSLYVDAGSGIRIVGDLSFPSGGTHFEFTPQAGVGGTYALVDNLNLMGGVRWFHMSNAGIYGFDRNPGHDSMQLYMGLMLAW